MCLCATAKDMQREESWFLRAGLSANFSVPSLHAVREGSPCVGMCEVMKWVKEVAAVGVVSWVLLYSLDVQIVMGTETAPAKTEQAPAPAVPSGSGPAQAQPKPRAHENESKPSPKSSPGSSSTENLGKEPVQPKPEAPHAPPKPSVAKPPQAANGGGSSKPSAVPQLPLEITGDDGVPMALVPVGEFIMGSDKGDDDEKPVHKVFLDSFYVDKFEVSNRRFAKFVKAMLLEPPWSFADTDTPIVHADRPVRWVNWWEALGYCLWVGKRLPTEAEWEKAARGSDARIYPWGNDAPTPAHAIFGLKEGTDTVSPIGNREAGKSPYGVHDMAGNLYEWTLDWYSEHYYTDLTAINPRGPLEGTAKVQRGGSYTNSPYRLRSAFRTKGDPLEHEHNVGFRCAKDAPK